MANKIFILLFMVFMLSCQSAKQEFVPQKLKKTEKKRLPQTANPAAKISLGIDQFIAKKLDLVKDKRVGLVTNPSGVNGNLLATSDILFNHPEVNLVALFGPEHGVRGDFYAGDKVGDEIDPKTGVIVYSLYGQNRKPTAKMLENIDVLMVDIQDIGLRAYTYIYTMAMVMEAAAENNKKVIVLDRPNPVDGETIEGNIVEEGFYSFVGLYPIPYRPGMTIGELALYFNAEYNINCDLTVIPMDGWNRSMYWGDTGLAWVPTSPHVPHWETILYMIATGTIGELHSLQVGVGYTSPFEMVGAPWINAEEYAEALNALKLPGIIFRPLHFRPYYSSFKDQPCQGVQLHITDHKKFVPYVTGLHILKTTIKLYPQKDLFNESGRVRMFGLATGTDKFVKMLPSETTVPEMENMWQTELNSFKDKRKKYLIY